MGEGFGSWAFWRQQYSLESIHTSSLCIRHGLTQFKVLHRLHYSRDKLSKLFPTVDPGCPRCSYVPTTIGHMFWSCTSLNDYWRQIFDEFSKICGQTIAPDYHTAIFGVPPPSCKVSNLRANALASLLARRLILFNWKSNTSPSFLQWLREVLSFLPLEKLRYKIYKARKNFTLTWSPFIEFVEGFPFQWYTLTLVVLNSYSYLITCLKHQVTQFLSDYFCICFWIFLFI